MTALPKALAQKMVERAKALGLKGAKADAAALDFYCGAAAALEIVGLKTESEWLGRVAFMLVSVRGYVEVARLAAEADAEPAAPSLIAGEWNTGRRYTEAGQIIRARLEPDGSILFADLSRGINGRIAASAYPIEDAAALRRRVMVAYDTNTYRADAASHEYAHAMNAEARS